MKVSLHPAQYLIAQDEHRFKVICAGRRFGKALDLDTKIPLYSGGFSTMNDLVVGDVLIDEKGLPTKVTGTQIFNNRPCYEITFSDNTKVIADENHEWFVWDKPARKANGRAINPICLPKVLETKQMAKNVIYNNHENNYSIQTTNPVKYKKQNQPIHPYIIGIWLGDGHSYSATITISDEEIVDKIRSFGYDVGRAWGKYAWRIYNIQPILKRLNLIQNKHIPDNYLYGSVEQRIWLLKGLMDSDGTSGKTGHCSFCQKDKKLAKQVQILLNSLGQKTVLITKKTSLNQKFLYNSYEVTFTPSIEVFSLSRKLRRQVLDKEYPTRKMRYITSIKKVENRTTKCVEVDSQNHLYLVTESFIPTHNSVLARMIMLKWAISQEGLYWIVAPTFQQGKDVHWYQGFKREIPSKYIVKWNDSELSVDIKTENGGISRIQIKSAEQPDRLKGVKLRGLIVDEIASMRNWDWIWQEALRPTLTDFKAPAIFISTPKGYNHFYDLYNTKSKNYKSFRFTSYDNPHIAKEEIDEAKETSTEDYFAQEYLAEFKKYTGLVYKDFTRDLIKEIDDFSAVYWLRGCDRGFTNPTAVAYIMVDKDDNWYMVDEIYKTKMTNNELSQLLVNMNEKYQIKDFELSTMDSAQAGDIAELQQLGHDFIPCSKESGEVNKSYIAWKIQKFSERLKSGRFFIHPRCVNTIREFEYYRYPEQKDNLNSKEEPEKVNDHEMDALADLNSYYDHFYSVKVDPFKDRIPGTYVRSYPDKTDESEEDIDEELNIQELW